MMAALFVYYQLVQMDNLEESSEDLLEIVEMGDNSDKDSEDFEWWFEELEDLATNLEESKDYLGKEIVDK